VEAGYDNGKFWWGRLIDHAALGNHSHLLLAAGQSILNRYLNESQSWYHYKRTIMYLCSKFIYMQCVGDGSSDLPHKLNSMLLFLPYLTEVATLVLWHMVAANANQRVFWEIWV